MSSELTRLTAAELAEKIHSREVSAVEVAQAHLDRIAAVDGQVHAFLHVAEEAALASATLVDEACAAGTPPASPLAGRAAGAQGRLHHDRHAHHRGLEDPRGLAPAVRRHGHRAAAGGRDHDPGQDQHGRVRHGLLHRELRLRPHAQPVGPRPRPRRLRRRLGGGAGRVRGAAGDRHRHRRLDPPARRGHRHGRGEAHLRRGVALRADRLRVVAGPGRPVRAHRARRRAAARGDRRATTRSTPRRSTRRCPPVVAAAREGARGDLSGLRVGVVRELGGEGYQPGVRASFEQAVAQLREAGRRARRGELPALRVRAGRLLPDPAQRGVVQPGAVRRDALRPARAPAPASAEEVMAATREAGFGAEVKRRIILGTYALSVGLLRRLLRAGAEGAHADHARLRRRVRARPTCWSRPPRRPRRSRSARRSTTRWPCTSTTSPRSRPTSRAPRRCPCRPGWPPTTGPAGRPADHGARAGRGRDVPGGGGVRGVATPPTSR